VIVSFSYQTKSQQDINPPIPSEMDSPNADLFEPSLEQVAMVSSPSSADGMQSDRAQTDSLSDTQGELIALAIPLTFTIVVLGVAIVVTLHYGIQKSIELRNKKTNQATTVLLNNASNSLRAIVEQVVDAVVKAGWFALDKLDDLRREFTAKLEPFIPPFLRPQSKPAPASPPPSISNEPFDPPLPSAEITQSEPFPTSPPLAPLPPESAGSPVPTVPRKDDQKIREAEEKLARARQLQSQANIEYYEKMAEIERSRKATIEAYRDEQDKRYTQYWQESLARVSDPAMKSRILQESIDEYEKSAKGETLDLTVPIPKNAGLFQQIVVRRVLDYERSITPMLPDWYYSLNVPSASIPNNNPSQPIGSTPSQPISRPGVDSTPEFTPGPSGKQAVPSETLSPAAPLPTVIAQPTNPADSITVFPDLPNVKSPTHTGYPHESMETQLGGFGETSQPSTPLHTGHGKTERPEVIHAFESKFRGPAAKEYDWEHIFNNHAPWGVVAKQRLRQNPDYIRSIFEGMSENEIKETVQRAWENREKVETQVDPLTGEKQIRYRAYDEQSRKTIEIWQNAQTGIVKSAYPLMQEPSKEAP
jgi:hypothetical protein